MKVWYVATQTSQWGTIAKRKTIADVEVPDNATEDEIEAAVKQNFLNGHSFEIHKKG